MAEVNGLQNVKTNTAIALQNYNSDHNVAWDFGTNWSNVKTDFETFINKYLFPKLNESTLISVATGNRFDWLAKEQDFIGQYSEEYVIMDAVPVAMNLSKSEELMLKRNYPAIASKLYGSGISKKLKFTLNNNDVRHNFATLKDATQYALGVYKKRISDINVQEEFEIKGMLVDYALNVTTDKREAADLDTLADEVFEALLNLQNNSPKYNETALASGGAIGRYTTNTTLDKLVILTTDKVKAYLLNSKIAQTYQVAGLDFTSHIISFDDLGGTYKLTAPVTIANVGTVNEFKKYGDYQLTQGDILPEGSIITFDVSGLSEFTDKVKEIKPDNDNFAYIFDVDKLRYKRYTKDMLDEFYNPEFREYTYWLHYHSTKNVSPFFNNILVYTPPVEEPAE